VKIKAHVNKNKVREFNILLQLQQSKSPTLVGNIEIVGRGSYFTYE